MQSSRGTLSTLSSSADLIILNPVQMKKFNELYDEYHRMRLLLEKAENFYYPRYKFFIRMTAELDEHQGKILTFKAQARGKKFISNNPISSKNWMKNLSAIYESQGDNHINYCLNELKPLWNLKTNNTLMTDYFSSDLSELNFSIVRLNKRINKRISKFIKQVAGDEELPDDDSIKKLLAEKLQPLMIRTIDHTAKRTKEQDEKHKQFEKLCCRVNVLASQYQQMKLERQIIENIENDYKTILKNANNKSDEALIKTTKETVTKAVDDLSSQIKKLIVDACEITQEKALASASHLFSYSLFSSSSSSSSLTQIDNSSKNRFVCF